MTQLSFIHHYAPPSLDGAPVLLMLHGTGGSEHDLVPFAAELLPGAGVLSPRGKVLERGMARFFRRFEEGVFDLDDLRIRTADLAAFVAEASERYGFDPRRVSAVGFSNGANIAGSLLLLTPEVLQSAVLLRAMVPIVPDPMPVLNGTPVLISNGQSDPLIPVAETERLAALLRAAGAEVTLTWHAADHQLTRGDVTQARAWLNGTDIKG